MNQFMSQFYGLSEDILGLLGQIRKRMRVYVVVTPAYPEPRKCLIFPPDSALTALSDFSWGEIFITITEPDTLIYGPSQLKLIPYPDFGQTNSEYVKVRFGGVNGVELYESQIWLKYATREALAKWKTVLAFFRKATKAGLWVFDPKTGVSGFYRQFRYFLNAQKWEAAGRVIKQFPDSRQLTFTSKEKIPADQGMSGNTGQMKNKGNPKTSRG